MLLGKRKNNCISSILEPLPKRAKYSLDSYFSELEKTFKKIKLVHDKDCKLNFQIDFFDRFEFQEKNNQELFLG